MKKLSEFFTKEKQQEIQQYVDFQEINEWIKQKDDRKDVRINQLQQNNVTSKNNLDDVRNEVQELKKFIEEIWTNFKQEIPLPIALPITEPDLFGFQYDLSPINFQTVLEQGKVQNSQPTNKQQIKEWLKQLKEEINFYKKGILQIEKEISLRKNKQTQIQQSSLITETQSSVFNRENSNAKSKSNNKGNHMRKVLSLK